MKLLMLISLLPAAMAFDRCERPTALFVGFDQDRRATLHSAAHLTGDLTSSPVRQCHAARHISPVSCHAGCAGYWTVARVRGHAPRPEPLHRRAHVRSLPGFACLPLSLCLARLHGIGLGLGLGLGLVHAHNVLNIVLNVHVRAHYMSHFRLSLSLAACILLAHLSLALGP